MKIGVLSFGGSLLFKDHKLNYNYLNDLKKLLTSYKNRKFVIVVGGGSVARMYLGALEHFNADKDFLGHFGIAITRTNARLVANAFGNVANTRHLPKSLKDVQNLLAKHKIVCCGGLRYEADQTSDSTGAKIAHHLKTDFVNMTNVKGLYTRDPKKYKDAKFIPKISYRDFSKIVRKMKYKPGQHFVLDQHAARIIEEHKVKTSIIGGSLSNLKNLLDGKKFVGTVIR